MIFQNSSVLQTLIILLILSKTRLPFRLNAPPAIGGQIIHHRLEDKSDYRRVIHKAESGNEIGNHIERRDQVEQRAGQGRDRFPRHLAVRSGRIVFQQRKDGVYRSRVLLKDRNVAWLPQIERLFTTPEVELVMVGTGHLVGPDSVLKMLENKGYTVRFLR